MIAVLCFAQQPQPPQAPQPPQPLPTPATTGPLQTAPPVTFDAGPFETFMSVPAQSDFDMSFDRMLEEEGPKLS